MSNRLTRESILALVDITVKDITVPDTIPVWGGQTLSIKQLTRGEQDEYLRRQYGSLRLKQQVQGRKTGNQEMAAPDLFGHDAWICIKGLCDEQGTPLFTDKDMASLNKKSGEAIGWLAKEILKFSNMTEEAEALSAMEEDTKN